MRTLMTMKKRNNVWMIYKIWRSSRIINRIQVSTFMVKRIRWVASSCWWRSLHYWDRRLLERRLSIDRYWIRPVGNQIIWRLQSIILKELIRCFIRIKDQKHHRCWLLIWIYESFHIYHSFCAKDDSLFSCSTYFILLMIWI
jgi:hypothetical protein